MSHREIPDAWLGADTIPAAEGRAFLIKHYPDLLQEETRSLMIGPSVGSLRGPSWVRVRFYSIRYTAAGDYVGSFVEAANRETLLKECPSILDEIGYHYVAAAAAGFWGPGEYTADIEDWNDPATDLRTLEGAEGPWDAREFEVLCESLDALEGYPVLDGELWSEMEHEAQVEAWEEAWDELDHEIERALEYEIPDGMVPNVAALAAWGRDHVEGRHDWWGLAHVEGISAYVDVETLASQILDIIGETDGAPPLYIPDPRLVPGTPEHSTPGGFAARTAYYNARIAEIRTEALRYGSDWDVG